MNILDSINIALNLAKQGKTGQAEKIYLELLAKYPDDIRILPFLGWLYISIARYKDAVEVFEKVNRTTKDINVITGLGLAFYHLNNYRAAYKYLRIAADEKPSLDILEKLITCGCERTNQPEVMFGYAKKMKELYPDSPKTWDSYILAALCAGHFEEAESYCAQKLEQNPNSPVLYISAGLVQEVLYSNYQLALECYKKAYELLPSISALYNMSLMYSALKNFPEAEKCLLDANKLEPDSPTLNTTLYILYARKQEFQKSYHYLKKSILHFGKGTELKKLWEGGDYINDVLYVYGDQGIGDIIMYSRYIPYLRNKFKKVILALPDTLVPLYREIFKSAFYQVVSVDEPVKYDKSVMMTFVPYYLDLDFKDGIPMSEGYLKVKDSSYSNIDKSKFSVGIVWEAGGTGLRGPLDRTMNPKFLDKLLTIKNVNFYSLQVNPAMNACEMYPSLIDLGSGFENFLSTAHAINNLDLVVTIDTSVAHLAGAMGKKVLIMLPYTSDWRWFGAEKNTTPWYDSAELFTQKTPSDWTSVVSDVTQKVQELAANN